MKRFTAFDTPPVQAGESVIYSIPKLAGEPPSSPRKLQGNPLDSLQIAQVGVGEIGFK